MTDPEQDEERLVDLDSVPDSGDNSLWSEIQELTAERNRLAAAIRLHRDQRGDDRCWLDDLQLYEVLGELSVPDNRVGDKAAMLANCSRFIDRRCEGGGWPSYRELEAKVGALRESLEEITSAFRFWYEVVIGLSCGSLDIAIIRPLSVAEQVPVYQRAKTVLAGNAAADPVSYATI